ncbi:antitoxin VbhA family protein [Microbacterium sp. PA5]|uniref:antitoxin VbhA family protein n=1 Tax=Microbacterium sp. PA5 TaxID=3416654 RepID=UPI003CEDE587
MTPRDSASDREERERLAVDTMASWALDGLNPPPGFADEIREWVDGRVTIDEWIERTRRIAAAD